MATRPPQKQINISTARKQLISDGFVFNNSALEAELLLSLTLKKDRVFIISHPEYILSPEEKKRLKLLFKKRLAGWPLAYLQGFKYFYGLKFKVNSDVLTPRPETELIIDKIIAAKPENNLIIDMGTGSGCIITSLAKKLNDLKIKNKYLASDISTKALKIAIQNAKDNRVAKKIKFVHGSLLKPLEKKITEFLNKKTKTQKEIIIIANLPYLSDKQIKDEASIQKEPRLALWGGGKNGEKIYLELIKQLKLFLDKEKLQKNNLPRQAGQSLKLTAILEIDPIQNKILPPKLKTTFKKIKINTIKDFSLKKRFLEIIINNI